MITAKDIVDIYKRTGLKPSDNYRDWDNPTYPIGNVIGGCVVTAIYVDDNGIEGIDKTTNASKMQEYCRQKLGVEESNSLEAGFCDFGEDEGTLPDYYRVGKEAAAILMPKEE